MTKEHKRMMSGIDREIEVDNTISAVVAATLSVIVPMLMIAGWMLIGY